MLKQPIAKDLKLATIAVSWDDETPDKLMKAIPDNNSPSRFLGTDRDLSAIRDAMKRYEEQEAGIMEDKAYYDSRYRLQFIETRDDVDSQV